MVGLGTGLFFGLTMAIALTSLRRWSMKRRGMDPATTDSAVDVRESVMLPLPPDQALEHCRTALEAARFASVRIDPASRVVHARAKVTWASFGETIECSAHPADGGSRVEIRSRPVVRTTIVDYGKNRENVQRIRATMARQGSLAPTSPA